MALDERRSHAVATVVTEPPSRARRSAPSRGTGRRPERTRPPRILGAKGIAFAEPAGTPKLALFRAVIAAVPRGKVITYGQVAAAAGFPGAARLTVWALQESRGVPWQRVVGAGGHIALTGELGREQRLRLEIEGVTFRGGRVRLDRHGWTPRASRKRRNA